MKVINIAIEYGENLGGVSYARSKSTSNFQAEKLFNLISKYLTNEEILVLDFKDVTNTGMMWIKIAVGQVYQNFPESCINTYLIIRNMNDFDKMNVISVLGMEERYRSP